MRLPLILAALAVSAPAGSAGPAPASAASPDTAPTADMPVLKPGVTEPKDCPPTSRYHAAKDKYQKRPFAQKLTELPMGDMYAAVYRHIGRCEAPIIVRYGIGGSQR